MAITLIQTGSEQVDWGDIAGVSAGASITICLTFTPSATPADSYLFTQWGGTTTNCAFLMQIVDSDEIGFTVRDASTLMYGQKTVGVNMVNGTTYRIVARISGIGGTRASQTWINGVACTMTSWQMGTPSSINDSTEHVLIGCLDGGDTTGGIGAYSEIGMWAGAEIPDAICMALSLGVSPAFFRENGLLYARLLNTADTMNLWSGGAGTLVGGANAAHPSVFYPSGTLSVAHTAAYVGGGGGGSRRISAGMVM